MILSPSTTRSTASLLPFRTTTVHAAADEIQERGGAGFAAEKVMMLRLGVAGDCGICRVADIEGDVVAVGGDQG